MATVIAGMSVSLDGFIAFPNDDVGPLFDWYGNGDVEVRTDRPGMTWHVSAASAAVLRDEIEGVGAILSGRRLFDITNGWGGEHPFGVPIVVATRSIPDGWPRTDTPFPVSFVTTGIEDAVAAASEIAGDHIVAVGGAHLAEACMNVGLLDEIGIDLIPVLLGEGIRFFENLHHTPLLLEDPTVVEGTRVLHLRYRVPKETLRPSRTAG